MNKTISFPYYIYRAHKSGDDVYFKDYSDAKDFLEYAGVEYPSDHITAVLLHTKPFWEHMEILNDK